MSNSKLELTNSILAFGDVLNGYSNSTLGREGLQGKLLEFLSDKDPNKIITNRLLKTFKKNLKRRAKLKAFRGTRLRSMKWGSLIKKDEALRDALKPPVIGVMMDDVGEVIVPVYPEGTNFEIDYTGLYCEKRTGDRFLIGPSDEPYVITSAVTTINGNNQVRTERHPIDDNNRHYDDVDSGESRVGPIASCWTGLQTEISLVVTVMENDEGDPDAYKNEIAIIVGAAATVAAFFGVPLAAALAPFAVQFINWLVGSGDDVIGVDTVIINPRNLKLSAINPGLNFNQTGILYNFNSFHDSSGEYQAFFKVDADRQPIENPNPPNTTVRAFNNAVLAQDTIPL